MRMEFSRLSLASPCGIVSMAVGMAFSSSAYAQVAPTITTQPVSQIVNDGENAVFTVEASGDAPLTYQWRRNGVNLVNGGRIAGATTPTLSITGALQQDAGRYTVVVTNATGNATSNFGYFSVRSAVWNQFMVNTLPPNGASPITFDFVRDIPVVWTSNCSADPQAATWELLANTWQIIPTLGRPATCARGYLVYDPLRRVSVQFGGTGADNRAYEYNGNTWVRSELDGPVPRFGHRMVAVPSRESIFVFGGRRVSDNVLTAESYEYTGVSWNTLAATGPAPRQDFAMAYDPRCNKVVVFGGNGAAGQLGDTWEYDVQAQTWSQHTPANGGPSPRSASTMAYYPDQQAIYMFGGLVGSNFVNGLWRYDCTTHTWTLAQSITNPPAAQGYMTYDDARPRLLMVQNTQVWELLTYAVGCPADFNNNNVVNTQDLFDFINGFFQGTADFTGDGAVNSQDFFDYLAAFFTPC